MDNLRRRREFNLDMEKEAKIAKKTDEILTKLGLSPQRTNDIESQHKGCDFILDGMIVDEKMNSRYWDSEMKSYAIELENNGHKVGGNTGWFYNEIATTTHYLFVWIRATDKYLNTITEWEGMLIPKSILVELLDKMGCSKEKFHEKIDGRGRMTRMGSRYVDLWRACAEDTDERICLYQCNQNEENNINLRLPKSWLKKLACRHIVWKNGRIVDYKGLHPKINAYMNDVCELIKNDVPPIKSQIA